MGTGGLDPTPWHHRHLLCSQPVRTVVVKPPSSPRLPVCPRPFDVSGQGYNNWTFMSTHFWDEDPRGLWTLVLENKGYYFNKGESQAQAGARAPPAPCSGAGGLLTAPKPKARGSRWSPLRD